MNKDNGKDKVRRLQMKTLAIARWNWAAKENGIWKKNDGNWKRERNVVLKLQCWDS